MLTLPAGAGAGVHSTLRMTTAMEAGISDHIWTIAELCGLLPEMPSATKRIDKGLILKAPGEASELAKPLIHPIFVLPSSLIAIAPFRYLWNNPPSFVGKNVWLAFFTPVIVFFVIALALSYLMTVCWRLWKSN